MSLSKELYNIRISIIEKHIKKDPVNAEFLKIRYSDSLRAEISEKTKFLDGYYTDINIGQRMWHIVKDQYELIYCKCGTPNKFHRFSNGYFNTCGDKECKKREKSDSFKSTIKTKYQGKYFTKGSESRKKYEETMMNRYNTIDNFSGEFADSNKKKMIEKYGSEHPLKCKDLVEKRNKTCIEKHGTLDFLNCEKSKNTKLEKYGTENIMNVPEIKKKVSENMILTKHNLLNDKLQNFNLNLISYSSELLEFVCKSCTNKSTNHPVTINAKLRSNINPCNICSPKPLTHSNMEKEVVKFIESITDYTVKENVKKYNIHKKRYEIDILIDELNLGFEFNGLYWHSELYKEPGYHIGKSMDSKNGGIKLIHIWEDDWTYNQNICKSIISNSIGNSQKIYARKCRILEIPNNEYKDFCNDNHLQGYGLASIRIGLFFNDKLVSVMGFSKIRKAFNKGDSGTKDYELIRLCTINGFNVIGGASRMIKYFEKKYNPELLMTYCDISISPDEEKTIYNKLGFTYIGKTTPGYFWIVDKKRRHRLNYTKHKLLKSGGDPNKTGIEIMHDRGYNRIWDCGNFKYIKYY